MGSTKQLWQQQQQQQQQQQREARAAATKQHTCTDNLRLPLPITHPCQHGAPQRALLTTSVQADDHLRLVRLAINAAILTHKVSTKGAL